MKDRILCGIFWGFSAVALIGASQGFLLIPLVVGAPFLFVALIACLLDTKIFPEE